jgi:hypothetical protein
LTDLGPISTEEPNYGTLAYFIIRYRYRLLYRLAYRQFVVVLDWENLLVDGCLVDRAFGVVCLWCCCIGFRLVFRYLTIQSLLFN